MKIEPHVHFVVKFVEPDNYDDGRIDNIEDLKNYIYCQGLGQKVSYALNVSRQVYFLVNDKGNYHMLQKCNGEKGVKQDIITDSFTFIVADKLTYFEDLQKYLLEEALSASCQDVVLKNFAWFDMKQPIFFTGRYEWNGSFLPDAHVKDRPLLCRPLTEKDIVLNKNLQQIFPKKTDKIPRGLVQLFKKTTEKIY